MIFNIIFICQTPFTWIPINNLILDITIKEQEQTKSKSVNNSIWQFVLGFIEENIIRVNNNNTVKIYIISDNKHILDKAFWHCILEKEFKFVTKKYKI